MQIGIHSGFLYMMLEPTVAFRVRSPVFVIVQVRAVTRYRYGVSVSAAVTRCSGSPYGFIGFGAMDVTKPYKFIWFCDVHGP